MFFTQLIKTVNEILIIVLLLAQRLFKKFSIELTMKLHS